MRKDLLVYFDFDKLTSRERCVYSVADKITFVFCLHHGSGELNHIHRDSVYNISQFTVLVQYKPTKSLLQFGGLS